MYHQIDVDSTDSNVVVTCDAGHLCYGHNIYSEGSYGTNPYPIPEDADAAEEEDEPTESIDCRVAPAVAEDATSKLCNNDLTAYPVGFT